MKPLFSIKEAKELDHALIEKHSLSEPALIDSAAKEAFDAVKDKLLHGSVLFLIGPGNNGSDGLEMARLLSRENQRVSLFFLSEKGSSENMRRRERLSYLDRAFEIKGYDVIVDALFGFSFHGGADESLLEIINEVNDSGSFVVSIDVPSAFLIRADITVELMCGKLELYHPLQRARAGRIILRNPGFPEEDIILAAKDSFLIEDSDYSLSDLPSDFYKKTRGHVAVMGGSEKYPGAPILTSLAAFHASAGLLTLISEKSVLDRAYSSYPSIMQREDASDLSIYDAIAIGPGWGSGSAEKFRCAVESGKPLVIDADGIKHIKKGDYFSDKAIITPHIGEYKRLCDSLSIQAGLESTDSLKASLTALSSMLGCVVVLKSSTVWIAYSGRIYVYDGVNPSLGVAGSGDVLTGIIASLLAQGTPLVDAAISGVIMHQKAGRKARDKYGYYSAEELIGEIER